MYKEIWINYMWAKLISRVLRAILCNNHAKWEMENFDLPPPLKFCMQLDIVGDV